MGRGGDTAADDAPFWNLCRGKSAIDSGTQIYENLIA